MLIPEQEPKSRQHKNFGLALQFLEWKSAWKNSILILLGNQSPKNN